MSALVKVKTKMKSADMIVEALKLMGVPAAIIQQREDGSLKMDGYRGKDWGNVEVLIPKAFHSGYSDVGFVKDGDTYLAKLDHIDEYSLARKLKQKGSFTEAVGQWYSAAVSKKTLRDQGFQVTVKQDGDKVRVSAQQF